MALTCQAAVTRHAEEPALEPSSGQAGSSHEQADTRDGGIRLTTSHIQDPGVNASGS